MSLQALQELLCQAVVDVVFQTAPVDQPQHVVQEHHLSPDEAALLLTTFPTSMPALVAAIEVWRRAAPQRPSIVPEA